MAHTEYPPLVKAALIAVCFVGIWSACILLYERTLFRNVLQPLVFSFMVVGVLTPVVEAIESILKLMIGFCLGCASIPRTISQKSIRTPLIENASSLEPRESRKPALELTTPKEWRRELAKEAVKNDSLALEYAPKSIKNDKAIVADAVARDPQALWFASSRLQDNREIVMSAVKQNGMMLACASDRLRADPQVTQAAVIQNGLALQYALMPENKRVEVAEKREGGCCDVESKVNTLADKLEPFVKEGERKGGYCPRILAVLLTLIVTCFFVSVFVVQVVVRRVQAMDYEPYLKGLAQLEDRFNVNQTDVIDTLRARISERQEEAGVMAASFSQMLIMCSIYTLMLLINPMKEILPVFDVVRTYFARKTLSNTIYATITCIILGCLHCTVMPILGVVTFFISFIPEIGAVISCILPVPLFLLDARVELHARYTRAATCLGLMVLNKFAVGNGVEAVLMGMGTSGNDEHREAGHTHPALMIFIVLVGATIWGASGTLFAVPATWLIQAYVREQRKQWDMKVSRDPNQLWRRQLQIA